MWYARGRESSPPLSREIGRFTFIFNIYLHPAREENRQAPPGRCSRFGSSLLQRGCCLICGSFHVDAILLDVFFFFLNHVCTNRYTLCTLVQVDIHSLYARIYAWCKLCLHFASLCMTSSSQQRQFYTAFSILERLFNVIAIIGLLFNNVLCTPCIFGINDFTHGYICNSI